MKATIAPRALYDWAGLAVKAPIYESIPTGQPGAESYRKLLRYSQGVVFKFSGKGFVYRLDVSKVTTLLTSFIVLLGVASSFTEFVAKFLWPTREIICNKARERLAVDSRLAEIGIKAASHAVTFASLAKRDHRNQTISVDDLALVFARARAPLTEGERQTLAALIVSRSNDDDPNTELDALREMDFVEFMNAMEGGSGIPFGRFKKMVMQFAAGAGYIDVKGQKSPPSRPRIEPMRDAEEPDATPLPSSSTLPPLPSAWRATHCGAKAAEVWRQKVPSRIAPQYYGSKT